MLGPLLSLPRSYLFGGLQNRLLIEEALKDGGGSDILGRLGGAAAGFLGGAQAGSVIPGIGNITGGVIGGIAGLFS